MDPGDILYSNVCNSPLVVMVLRGDGQYFDFVAGAFAVPVVPFSVAQFCLRLKHGQFFPTTQRCVIPGAAAADPQAELQEAVMPSNGIPQPTQSYWIGSGVTSDAAGVTMAMARGCIVRFTG